MKGITVQANKAREFFVTHEMPTKVLEACPDAEWRLLFALSRFAGLRCPSEHLALRWADINWEARPDDRPVAKDRRPSKGKKAASYRSSLKCEAISRCGVGRTSGEAEYVIYPVSRRQ